MKRELDCSEVSLGDEESEFSLKTPMLIPSENTARKLKKLQSYANGYRDLENVRKLPHNSSEQVLTKGFNRPLQPAPLALNKQVTN